SKLYRHRAADQACEIRLNHYLLKSAPWDDVLCAPRQSVRPDPDFDTAGRRAVYSELEILRRSSLHNTANPEMSGVVSVRVESDAVVVDDELHLVAFRYQMHSYGAGRGVFHDVLNRLLGDTVKRFFCRVVYVGFRFGHDLNLELLPCSDCSGEATQ